MSAIRCLTTHPHVSLLWLPVAQSLPMSGTHTYNLWGSLCIMFQLYYATQPWFTTRKLPWCPQSCHSSTPKCAPGKRHRGNQNWKAGNGNERSSQNVTACSRGNVGWNDPPHLFLKWVIRCSISWKAMTTNARIIILLYIKIYSQRSILFSCWSGWRWRSFNKLFIESVLS